MTQPKLAKSTRTGRRYTHPITHIEVPSVTTILGQIGKAEALKWWAAGEVAKYAVTNRETWQNLDTQAAVDLLKREPLRSLGRAADRGSDVHALAEALATTGQMPEWADHLNGYVAALEAFWRDHQPEPILVEATVFGDGYAGSFDLMCRLPIYGDETVILDYKTSKAVYGDTAAQLAAYANADEYHDPSTGEMKRVPPVHRGVVVRLGGDGMYEMVEMHLFHGYELFHGALEVWNAQQNQLIVGRVTEVAGRDKIDALRAEVVARIANIRELRPEVLEALRDSWPPGVPTLAQSTDHTSHQLQLVLSVVTQVELDHEVPFGPAPTPKKPPQKKTKTTKPKKTEPSSDEANQPVGEGAIQLLRDSIATADEITREAMKNTVTEALSAGFKMSLQQNPTNHRYLAALLAWVHIQQDPTRGTLMTTLAKTGKTGTHGEIIAQLTYQQIRALLDGRTLPK